MLSRSKINHMKHFDFDFSIIKQLPSYQKIIGLGWRDTTTPAQRSHGNIDFSGNPAIGDEKITIYYNGIIRGYSEATYYRSLQPGKWANLRPYRIKKEPSVIDTEEDYEPVLAVAYKYLVKRIHRYDQWLLNNARDLIRVFFDHEDLVLRDTFRNNKDFFDRFQYPIKKLHGAP
jgi:hypothetical protein